MVGQEGSFQVSKPKAPSSLWRARHMKSFPDTSDWVPSWHLDPFCLVFRSHPQFLKIIPIYGPEKPVVGPQARVRTGNSHCTQPAVEQVKQPLSGQSEPTTRPEIRIIWVGQVHPPSCLRPAGAGHALSIWPPRT